MSTSSTNILRELGWTAGSPVKDEVKSHSVFNPESLKEWAGEKVRKLLGLWSAFTGRKESPAQPEDQLNRFIEASRRLALSEHYNPRVTSEAPYGYFRGRPVIGECTKVNGGIFVGITAHESIVVDEKYGLLDTILSVLITRCSQIDQKSPTYEYQVFSKTVALTRETLRFSEEGVAQIQEKYSIHPDDKVTLDMYIKKKVGVARHQVLLAAYLLEKLRSRNFIKGLPSIEGAISQEAPQERLLFTSADGDVFRFDPTKGLGKTAIH